MTLRKFNAGDTVKYIGRKESYEILDGPDNDGDYKVRNKRTNQVSFVFCSRLSAIPSPPPKPPAVPKREFNVGDEVRVAGRPKVPYIIVDGPDSDGDYKVRDTKALIMHHVRRSHLSLWEEPKAPEPPKEPKEPPIAVGSLVQRQPQGDIYIVSKGPDVNDVYGLRLRHHLDEIHVPRQGIRLVDSTRAPIGSPPAPVESNHPRTKQAVEIREGYLTHLPTLANKLSNQEGKSIMSNINRTLVTVALLDNDSGLKVEHSLVHDFGSHVLEGSQEDLKMEIVMNNDMSNIVAVHNAKRAKETDLDILKRTGNKVKLQERKLSELTWVISTK